MAERASVGSVEALGAFKPAVVQFAELTQAALSAAESSATRTLDWLTRDRGPQLRREIQRLQEELTRSRTRMISRMDTMRDNPQPKVDDKLEFEAAKRKLRGAEEKLEEVRRWTRVLERAIEEYRGSVSQFGWFVRGELGVAVGALDQMGAILEEYTQIGRRPGATTEPAGPDSAGGAA
ncbi:MAG: hypothetical protein IT431_15965 [Phycisphaerales bacterium]|nr:hypothetical protein [Phycisphaerales bacterium]